MPYARAADGIRLHYRYRPPGGPPVLLIQGLGADKHGWDLQRLALAPRYRTIALDNRGAGRSDKPYGTYSLEQMADDAIAVLDARRRRHGPRRRRVDGRRDHPDRRAAAPRAGALAHARVHVVPQPPVAPRAARRLGRRPRPSAGMGAMTAEAARWVIGPRSFRRICRRSAGSGPLALRRPAARVRRPGARRSSPPTTTMAERARRRSGADAGDRRQPGHPHAARRQRGAGRADPDRRAGGDQRRRARRHDRARARRSTGCCSTSSAGPRPRTRRAVGTGAPGALTPVEPCASSWSALGWPGSSRPVRWRSITTSSCSTRDVRSGGRLATRRIGDAVLDHGAQFFTVRTDAFRHAGRRLGRARRRPGVVPRLRGTATGTRATGARSA